MLLTEQHLEFLSLKGGCTSSTESTHVKIPHCWKSHIRAHIYLRCLLRFSNQTGAPNEISLQICQ